MKDERTVEEILDELRKSLITIIDIAHMTAQDREILNHRMLRRKLSVMTEQVHVANRIAKEIDDAYRLISDGWTLPNEVRP